MEFDFSEVVLEEIALEGLDGITVDSLWVRLSVRQLSLDVSENQVRQFLWNRVVVENAAIGQLSFYELPVARSTVELYNRYEHVNPETGTVVEEGNYVPRDVYEGVTPVTDGCIRGSCKYYKERVDITEHVLSNRCSLDEVLLKYGNTFVIVATQMRREEVLRIPYVDPCLELNSIQYCILERIGRARTQGEVTIGKEAPTYKDPPKTMFYYRKKLIRSGLIKKQLHVIYDGNSGQNRHGLILMLPRFYLLRLTPVAVTAKKISDVLMNEEHREMEYFALRDKVTIKQRIFRHIFPSYLKNFKVYEVPNEDAKTSTRFVKLIKPVVHEEEESDGEIDDDDDEEGLNWKDSGDLTRGGKIFNPGSILADRTMLTQVLCVIGSCQSENGMSLREIGERLNLPKLEIRALTRTLERLNEITSIRVEEGRQKSTHYIPRNRVDDAMKQFESARKNLSYNVKDTVTFLRRANLIKETVKELKIVDQMFRLKKVVQEAEKDTPYTVDQKSIKNIVQKLAMDGHVRSIKTLLTCNDQVKKLHIVCDPSITADSPLIREKIEQWKFRFFAVTSDEHKELRKSLRKQSFKKESYTEKEEEESKEEFKLVYQPSIGRKYGLQPKMIKVLTLYKYLFYLLCTEEDASQEHDDWQMFVKHLPKGCNESGTCTLGDIIPRMPLSIFVQIVFITYIIPGLEEYLNDPVKKHHTLSMLPGNLRVKLLYKRKYIFNLVEILTSLSYMDLVSISYKELHPKETLIIKILRNPKIKDKGVLKEYDLQTLNDIETFSCDLTLHCLRSDCSDCCLDSRLFAHNQRNWRYTPRMKNEMQLRLNLPFKEKKKRASHPKAAELSNVQTDELMDLGDSTSLISADTIDSNSEKSIDKRGSDRPVTGKRKASTKRKKESEIELSTKKQKREATTTFESAASTSTKPGSKKRVKKAKKPPKPKTPRAPNYDNIDLAALKTMKKMRCDWSKDEDSFLLMCRVASILLDSSCPTFICVNRNTIRDELHKHFPETSKDKTAKACQRRIMYMLKKAKTRQNVIDWVVECKQDVEMMNIRRPEVPKSHKEVWQAAYLKLLYALLNKFQAHHLSHTPRSVVEKFDANSLEELLSKFEIINSEYQVLPDKPILHQDPQNVVDIYLNVVLNVLISTLMINHHSDSLAYQAHTLFKIYHRYPDTLIRSVVTKLQKNGTMSKLKKKCDVTTLRSRGATPFRISQHYLFLLKTRMCMDTLPRSLSSNFTVNDAITCSDAAIVTCLFTMQNVRLKIDIPENFIIFDDQKCSDSIASVSASDEQLNLDPKSSSRYALYVIRQRLSLTGGARRQMESLALNRCTVDCHLEHDVEPNLVNFNNILSNQMRSVPTKPPAVDGNKLLVFIKSKKELGATQQHIISFNGGVWPENEVANYLISSHIYRVGVNFFRYVHFDYIGPWLVHSVLYPSTDRDQSVTQATPIRFVARCWKNVNGVLDTKVLFKYLSGVLGHIMINPGIVEQELISYFYVCLPPVQVMEVVEMLVAVECVTVVEIESVAKLTLFNSGNEKTKVLKHFESTPQAFVNLCRLKKFLNVDD